MIVDVVKIFVGEEGRYLVIEVLIGVGKMLLYLILGIVIVCEE